MATHSQKLMPTQLISFRSVISGIPFHVTDIIPIDVGQDTQIIWELYVIDGLNCTLLGKYSGMVFGGKEKKKCPGHFYENR
jgi:hypothetical protein